MINKTILVGRLTRDPELRKTGTGKSVTNFTVAVNRSFAKDETDFINCVAWNHTADFMANYLKKGALIGLEGRIQTGSYEDRDTGKKIYTTDVVVDNLQSLESKSQRESKNNTNKQYQKPDQQFDKKEVDPIDITSNDLPF